MVIFQQKTDSFENVRPWTQTDGKCCHLVAIIWIATTKGLRHASQFAPNYNVQYPFPTIPVFSVNIIHPRESCQPTQLSESLCAHHNWMTAFSSYHWRLLSAACGPPRSHPGPHWSAGGRPPCLLPSSGSQWWRLLSGPPADLHSGSHPRRPRGSPALWTWCRRQWSPGLWHGAAS